MLSVQPVRIDRLFFWSQEASAEVGQLPLEFVAPPQPPTEGVFNPTLHSITRGVAAISGQGLHEIDVEVAT